MTRLPLEIPRGWQPRRYQTPLWNYLDAGGKRAVAVWHRRAGKDSLSLNWTATAAWFDRVGVYWHMLPEAAQARKAIWDGVDRQGRRMIDQAFPHDIRAGKANETEMKIRLRNGSIWQVVGSDNYNSLVGTNPVGIVFSEYSLAKPAAWDFLRPILAENGGWAVFIYTPRGENHGYDLYQMARANPDWFCEVLPVSKTGAIGPKVIADERRSGMPDEMIQQEYFCSFSAPLIGSYYGKLLETAHEECRVGLIPYDPALPTHTFWDLGIGDTTAIWAAQFTGREIRIVRSYEASGHGLDHYVGVIRDWGIGAGDDWLPHDAKVRELGTGRSRVETLAELIRKANLPRRLRLTPNLGLEDGVNAARVILPQCRFDLDRNRGGLKALRHYEREWDEGKRCFKTTPLHNWASHFADAFRYLAVAYREIAPPAPPPKPYDFQSQTIADLVGDPTSKRPKPKVTA